MMVVPPPLIVLMKVITIAHRLETVADSDRIVVLDAGKVVQFDTPAKMSRAVGSPFEKMIRGAGKRVVEMMRGPKGLRA